MAAFYVIDQVSQEFASFCEQGQNAKSLQTDRHLAWSSLKPQPRNYLDSFSDN